MRRRLLGCRSRWHVDSCAAACRGGDGRPSLSLSVTTDPRLSRKIHDLVLFYPTDSRCVSYSLRQMQNLRAIRSYLSRQMHDFLYTVTTDARFFINCHDRFFCCGERLPPPAYLRPSHVSSRGNFRYKNAIRHMAVAGSVQRWSLARRRWQALGAAKESVVTIIKNRASVVTNII